MKNFFKNILISVIFGSIAGAVGAIMVCNNLIPTLNTQQSLSSKTTDNQEETVVNTVKKASPAVVSVVISKNVPIIERYFDNPFGDGIFDFRIPHLRQRGVKKQEIGGGSGFIVSSDGMVITNKHVVEDTEAEYTVFTQNGVKYKASVLAKDPTNDIAILKIDAKNLPFLELGDSNTLQVGQSVIAIGNALSKFKNTVSVGVVSGLSRSIKAGNGFGQTEQLEEVIQTDAAINPGNSGGPLLDLKGKVIGVNVAMAMGSENIGFSLPINAIKSVVKNVEKNGRIVRPFLGIRYVHITPAIKESNKLPVDYGALIIRGDSIDQLAVIPGSPANKAGIQEGDIILELDGEKIDNNTSLNNIISKHSVGDTIKLKLLSKGSEKIINVLLEELPQ